MKQTTPFLVIAAIILATAEAASSKCMYCRRMDKNAGFIVSYSYCNQTDFCLEDAWNYLNRDCLDGWQKGTSYELDYCEPDEIDCPGPFISSPEKYARYENNTWSLPSGAKCTVKLDATNGIARVIFDNTSFLGIEDDKAQIGDVITVETGIREITVYNGAETGPLTFDISFSKASALTAGAAALAAATAFW